MNKHLHILAALLIFSNILMAQEIPGAVEKRKGCGCAYSSIYTIGLLEGEAVGRLQLQTIQGVRYGKWFAGILYGDRKSVV